MNQQIESVGLKLQENKKCTLKIILFGICILLWLPFANFIFSGHCGKSLYLFTLFFFPTLIFITVTTYKMREVFLMVACIFLWQPFATFVLIDDQLAKIFWIYFGLGIFPTLVCMRLINAKKLMP